MSVEVKGGYVGGVGERAEREGEGAGRGGKLGGGTSEKEEVQRHGYTMGMIFVLYKLC